ncbi:MAG TPA: PKD domain-containing protein [Mycobacteriales bacterium]|nr:PKD domain-containing protein [Mycobacteriales bacterium]
MSNVHRGAAAAAALALGLAAGPAIAAPGRAHAGTPCFGRHATITSSANGAHVQGTAGGDVIVATGKGVVVNAGGGNDFICVGHAASVDGGLGNDHIQFVSGTIHGRLGNDTLVQKPGGKAKVFGDGGNDAVTLVSAGDVVDTGTGLDTLTVNSKLLDRITIVDRDGLVVNGQSRRIDAPTGAPTTDMSYDGDPGPVVYAPTYDQSQVLTADDEVEFPHVLAPNGRSLASWTVDFGDGYVRTGFGGLPPSIRHPYLFDGPHTITATQVDSSHKSYVRRLTVSTSRAPSVSLSNGPATPDNNRSFNASVTPGAGAAIASWSLDFGDGSEPAGNVGPPPTTFTHLYPVGDYTARLRVYDDHGNTGTDTQAVSVNPVDASARQVYLVAATVASDSFNPALGSGDDGATGGGAQAGPQRPVGNGGTVLAGQPVTLIVSASGPGTWTSKTIDWGDGCFGTRVDGPPTETTGECSVSNATTATSTHSYSGPGTRTIRVVLGQTGQPDVVSSLTINVAPRQTVAELQRVGIVAQGRVVLSTAGTSVAPGGVAWTFDPGDGRAMSYGYGTVPKSFTHTYPSGVYFPQLHLVDSHGLSVTSTSFVDATSQRARAQFGGGAGVQWVGGLVSTDASGNDEVRLSGLLVPSNGARPKSATILFGDGSSPLTVHGVQDGQFGGADAVHGYSAVREMTAHLQVKDTHNQTAVATTHVSIAGPVVLTGPADDTVTVGATHNVSTVNVPINLSVVTGLGALPEAYTIDWDGGTGDPVTGAYGALPSTLTRTYANPGSGTDVHNVVITYRNDHGSTAVLRIRVVIDGA